MMALKSIWTKTSSTLSTIHNDFFLAYNCVNTLLKKEDMDPVDSLENQLRHFGLIMAGIFSFIGAIFFFKNWIIAAGTLGVLILFFAGMGLLAPMSLLPVHRKWMRFAEVIGNFNAKVILSLTYFLVFTPIRIMTSIFREDPLSRKFEPGKETYWRDCKPSEPDAKRYEKQF